MPVKTSTGTNFPRKYQRIPRNYYQYWCYILATFLPFSAGTGNFKSPRVLTSSRPSCSVIFSGPYPQYGVLTIGAFIDNPPVQILYVGAAFPSRYRKKAQHKEFQGGGGLGAPKSFMLKFFECFICTSLSGRNFRRNSGKTPETLSELFLKFPSRVRLGCPKPYNSRQLRLPEHFQEHLFFQKWFRRGPLRAGHGIPSVLGAFLIQGLSCAPPSARMRMCTYIRMSVCVWRVCVCVCVCSLKFRRVIIRGAQPPRGSPRKFVSQRALRRSLRGLCGGLSEGSAEVSPRVLRGLSEGSAGVRGIF